VNNLLPAALRAAQAAGI